MKAIDKASAATADATARRVLEDARSTLNACWALEGLTLAKAAPKLEKATMRGRPRKLNSAVATAS